MTRSSSLAVRPRQVLVVATLLVMATTSTFVVGCSAQQQALDEGMTRFEVTDGEGRRLFERPVQIGSQITLTHVHSVTRRKIVETFVVLDADTLGMATLWFDRHGANLPYGPEVIDGVTTTYVELNDGSVLVDHHGRPLASLGLVVGSDEVGHTLKFADGEDLRLLDVARQWSVVDLRVTAAR